MRYLQRLFGLLILAIIFIHIDLGALFAILTDCRLELVIAAYLLNILAIWVKSFRWVLITKSLSISLGFWRAFAYYMAGIFLGVATPGRLGELGRFLYLKRDGIRRVPTVLASIVSDRLMDVCLLVIIGLVACLDFGLVDPASAVPWVVVVCLGLSVVLIYFFRSDWFSRSVRWFFNRYRSRELFRLIESGVREFFISLEVPFRKSFIGYFSITVFSYLLFFGSCWMLSFSLGIEIGVVEIGLMVGLANLVSLLPITVAGLGTRDAVFLWVFHCLGLQAAQALAFSALILAVTYVMNGLTGFVFFLFLGGHVDARSGKVS